MLWLQSSSRNCNHLPRVPSSRTRVRFWTLFTSRLKRAHKKTVAVTLPHLSLASPSSAHFSKYPCTLGGQHPRDVGHCAQARLRVTPKLGWYKS